MTGRNDVFADIQQKILNNLYIAIPRMGWAFVFFHFDFNIGTGLGSGQLDLLPSFMGFALILHELKHLAKVSPSAKLLRPLAWGLLLYDLDVFFQNSFEASLLTVLPMEGLTQLLDLLAIVVRLYFHFQLFTDLANAANIVGYPKEKRLLDARTWYVVLLTVLSVNNYLKIVNQWVAVGLLVSCIAAAVILCVTLLNFGRWGQKHMEKPGI